LYIITRSSLPDKEDVLEGDPLELLLLLQLALNNPAIDRTQQVFKYMVKII